MFKRQSIQRWYGILYRQGYKTSDTRDYLNNVYDRGHLAPAADFNCDLASLRKTFTYLNCALQYDELNRGVWRLLEEHERVLAKKYKVDIEVRCVFSNKSIKLKTEQLYRMDFIKLLDIIIKQKLITFQ
jgi:DNA/RNA endonuclease G (NUC1)